MRASGHKKQQKLNGICIWRSIYIYENSGSTCKKAATLHCLQIQNVLPWRENNHLNFSQDKIFFTNSAFKLASGARWSQSVDLFRAWMLANLATKSPLPERQQQQRRQIVWDCFLEFSNCPLAHTSGPNACRRRAQSQSADAGSAGES